MVEEDKLHETVMKICQRKSLYGLAKKECHQRFSFALEKLDQRTYDVGLFWVSFVRTWVTGVLPARVYQSLSIYVSVYLPTYIHTYTHTYQLTLDLPIDPSIFDRYVCMYVGW
jgi:hypothetical protein